MKIGKRSWWLVWFVVKICIFAPALFAYDIGLVLDQNMAYSGAGDESNFEFNGILVPRVSGLLGDNGEFFVSGGLNYQNDPW